MVQDRSLARRLAEEGVERGDALGWFESLYQQASGDAAGIPWADGAANPNLVAWLEEKSIAGGNQRALVVGCGLGDDAQRLAELGFSVTAFDISATAIEWCRRRFANSAVNYCVCDLFSPPADWKASFDFVFEAYTLQVLPPDMRTAAMTRIAECVAPGGTLLAIARGCDADEAPGQMPWPLLQEELNHFATCGLDVVKLEDYVDDEEPPVRRFRAEFRRTGQSA